ncbi:MAG: MarR family transcriptional regulator [Gemmatimonadetes bacterium]|nr:MAG: MarR family transcriptional regulator [Gemmatimonadota bacterium]
MAKAKKARLAAEAWKRVFTFFMQTRSQRDSVLARLALTPNDVRALTELDVTTGRTMRSLAEEWGCDASNATWIVDRLEKRGLVERRSKPGDRRVKLVVLTPAGAKTRKQLLDGMFEPPPELLALPQKTLEVLRDSLPGRPKKPKSSRGRS